MPVKKKNTGCKYVIATVSIRELDKLILPCKDFDACKISLRSNLVHQIGTFSLKLGLVHKYKQESKTYGSKTIPWKTVFEKKYGKKLLITEDQLFHLYNYVTTNKSEFGKLIRAINNRSSDEWNARYFYDHGHSLTSINQPYRDTCFKYCHKFPKRLQTSCPGCGECSGEKACKGCSKKKCITTKCH